MNTKKDRSIWLARIESALATFREDTARALLTIVGADVPPPPRARVMLGTSDN